MLRHSPTIKKRALWGIKYGVFPRIFDWRDRKDEKFTIFDQISCHCLFFYACILYQNPFLRLYLKNRDKNWTARAIRAFLNDFVAKANIGWLKIFQKAKNYICMKHPVYLWHLWVAMARQARNASSLTNNQKTSTVSDQIWRISAYIWLAWEKRWKKYLFWPNSLPLFVFLRLYSQSKPVSALVFEK